MRWCVPVRESKAQADLLDVVPVLWKERGRQNRVRGYNMALAAKSSVDYEINSNSHWSMLCARVQKKDDFHGVRLDCGFRNKNHLFTE